MKWTLISECEGVAYDARALAVTGLAVRLYDSDSAGIADRVEGTMPAAPQVAVNTTLRRMQDSDWALLIRSIREQRLIPVIGPDLIRVPFLTQQVTFERYVATRLAEHPDYHLSDADFLPLGLTLDQADFERCRIGL